MLKLVFGVIVLAALAAPASANEFWVQYDYSIHQCSIVEKKSADNDAGTQPDATAANTAPNAATSSAPGAATTPTMLPPGSAPANTTTIIPPTGPDSATASPAPATAPGTSPATPDAPAATSPDDDKRDPFAPTAEAWAKKKAEAEAAGTADVQTILIGTAMHSREEAESEMQIMRKCGLAN